MGHGSGVHLGSECISNPGGHNWSSKGPKAGRIGRLTTRKTALKRSFVDLKIAHKNDKLVEIWSQVLSLLRSHQPFLRSFFAASLRVRVASSIKRIMLTTPMKNRHENPRTMVIWCDEVAHILLENTSPVASGSHL